MNAPNARHGERQRTSEGRDDPPYAQHDEVEAHDQHHSDIRQASIAAQSVVMVSQPPYPARVNHEAVRRRRVVLLQKYLLNPPTKLAVHLGVVPGHALIETTGRKSGKPRRTIVGVHEDGPSIWVVAEQGRHAGYVRNIAASPQVRLRLRGRWRPATACIIDDDDPVERLRSFGRKRHARLVTSLGTSLLTLRFDLEGQ